MEHSVRGGRELENKLLLQVVDGLNGLRQDVTGLKEDVAGLKEDMKVVKSDITGLKEDVSGLKEGQSRIEKKLDAVYAQTAELTEFKTETKSDLAEIKGTLKFILNKNAETEKEIYLLKQSK